MYIFKCYYKSINLKNKIIIKMVIYMFIYIAIFLSKIIENAVGTLRLIVVANGKKKLGAILQGIVALVWILSTSIVIVDVDKNIFKPIVFVVGSIVGSYLGSIIEQKIGLGSNMLICVTKEKYETIIKEKLNNYQITTICEKDNNYSILLVVLKRREILKIIKILKHIDKDIIIISEKAKTLNNMV